jgi:hypothetical protein
LRLSKGTIGIWALAIWGVLVCYGASTGENSSLSESKIESAKGQVERSVSRSKEDELRRQVSFARESVIALTSDLAESNAEAELFRRKYSDLRLRMEALGLESADEDRARLEQRLLNAVSDLRLSRKECEQYRDQMLQLMEAVLHFLKTAETSDGQARLGVEKQLRAINAVMGRRAEAGATQPTLMDGSVVSVKEEWSLVVGNLGQQHGIRMGMPLRVVRGNRLIATLRVVDVRQKICGAVIQEMGSDKERIQVGDRLQADAHQNVIF